MVSKVITTSNPDKLAFAHLNVNSITNKFEMLSDRIKDNVDVMVILETKYLLYLGLVHRID